VATGFFVALEGIDGSGTTTQAAKLGDHLRLAGRVVHRTAEPSTGPVGRVIRKALASADTLGDEPLALLFAADRLDHLEREIVPALERGETVVSDRYLLSSLAYQGSSLPLEWVLSINGRARRPDASILLRVSAETAAGRRQKRGESPERFDELKRQRQIASAYERVFALSGVGATHVVDAGGEVDDVAAKLAQLVERLLG
jgi:dTMP kinase